MIGPLSGTRILDLTSVLMGPYATQLLGDYGADVIKVEPPDGDVMRYAGSMRNPGMGHVYMNANRNKRSLVIDLRKPAGRDIVLRLAQSADVLAYNIRPKAMERLGLSYEAVAAANPAIIYAGAFGFSQRGPYASRPAYDDLIQAMTGIPWLYQAAGADAPRYAPMVMADRMVGLQFALAIATALCFRLRTGRGQRVDVPMFEGLASVVLGEHIGGEGFRPALGPVGYRRTLTPDRRPYRTRDGYLCVLLYTDRQWRGFFTAIGRAQDFERDPRLASQTARAEHVDETYALLSDILLSRTTVEWLTLLADVDVPAARIHSIDDILNDEHLAAIGFFADEIHPTEGPLRTLGVPTEWSESQPSIRHPAPNLGAHTREVLSDAGYSDAEIETLMAAGAVRGP